MTNLPAIASYYKAIKVSHSYSIHWSAGLKILVSAVRFRLRAPFIPYFPTYICTLVRTSSSLKHECTPYSVSVSLALLLVADHVTQGATREMFTMVLSKLQLFSTRYLYQRHGPFYFQQDVPVDLKYHSN